MNDKMDLTQAEAIADLINATSEQAASNIGYIYFVEFRIACLRIN